jgi:hypothetical protein
MGGGVLWREAETSVSATAATRAESWSELGPDATAGEAALEVGLPMEVRPCATAQQVDGLGEGRGNGVD